LKKQKVVSVIPARMESSRFPGKPLVRILDLPMIEHVRRRVGLAEHVDEVVVATCNREILDAVTSGGGRAVMTANTHERCTDRVVEAMTGLDADIVLIVQGDEPLLDPAVLGILIRPLLERPEPSCTNLISVIHDERDLVNVDIVKTVLDRRNRVMFYSRAPIPYRRVRKECILYRQAGLSAFRTGFLKTYSELAPTPLEIAESVDFLRILEHGHPILGVVFDHETVGVDRPEDVGKVEEILRTNPGQKALYERILGRKG
jgi:3-deoxy-manno-octulosonate cytidylyltransferase (CMP-KDO synthetase)